MVSLSRGVRLPPFVRLGLVCVGFALLGTVARANELSDGWKQFRRGDYPAAFNAARSARRENPRNEEALRLEAEVLLVRGKVDEARTFLNEALKRSPSSLRLRLLLREAALRSGHPADAKATLDEMAMAANSAMRYRRDTEFLAALGEAGLLMNLEPRLVLDNFLKPAEQATAPSRDAFLAAGKLALEKHDYALASRTFQEGLKTFEDDPDFWFGLAASFIDGDRAKLVEYASHALELNPNHVPTRLLLAEHLIDNEDYAGAQRELARVRAVNPSHPRALALLAVITHLQNDQIASDRFRLEALATWKTNPEVDHLIGRKLSQKYRFTEGAAAQRRALEMDATFTPARMQLAEDLLRLGREDEGWKLANEAHDADPYDVSAYNLVTLHDQLGQFTTVTNDHFRVRMSKREASVYGDRALALLERARDRLTQKYGLTLDQPITVEIYPDPKDFAVRTFGMPGHPGYLGVCFGPVVTINSPATQRANWESVLWHEFTHVITLSLTKNKMPRWLSEGISVFEETQADPSWGRPMNVAYRQRILDGRLQPIRQMSGAFLQAKSQDDILFAYAQSALVVEFMVERYGFDSVKALLASLRRGTEINQALTETVAPLDDLERGFVPFAQAKARALGGGYDLTPPSDSAAGAVARLNPRNYPARLEEIEELVQRKAFDEAKPRLLELTRKAGYVAGARNAYTMLAEVCAALNDREGERAAWTAVAEHESDSIEAASRLTTLAAEAQNWEDLRKWSDRWLAINPLATGAWRALLEADEKRGQRPEAIAAARALLQLEPSDLPKVHYRLARLLQPVDPAEARKHTLLALAEAPRFRAAYELLDQLPNAETHP